MGSAGTGVVSDFHTLSHTVTRYNGVAGFRGVLKVLDNNYKLEYDKQVHLQCTLKRTSAAEMRSTPTLTVDNHDSKEPYPLPLIPLEHAAHSACATHHNSFLSLSSQLTE